MPRLSPICEVFSRNKFRGELASSKHVEFSVEVTLCGKHGDHGTACHTTVCKPGPDSTCLVLRFASAVACSGLVLRGLMGARGTGGPQRRPPVWRVGFPTWLVTEAAGSHPQTQTLLPTELSVL